MVFAINQKQRNVGISDSNYSLPIQVTALIKGRFISNCAIQRFRIGARAISSSELPANRGTI
jgi:hypothetical protein